MPPSSDPATRSRRDPVLLGVILAGAALLRLADLGDLPRAHYRDVALTAVEALAAAAGAPRVHYTYDEGLYANLVGLGFLVAGPSDLMVRLPGALAGILACWAVWRLGRVLGLDRAGLYGAAVLAVLLWHVILSRSGFRAVLLPLILTLAVAELVEAVETRSALRLLLAGALFGLTLHAYPAARFAPLILPVVGVRAWRLPDGGRRMVLAGGAIFAASALIVAAPILLDYLEHPEHLTSPHRVVSVFSPGLDRSEIPAHLGANLLRTLLMFHARGDANPRHNLPHAPLLDPLAGLLFLAGLACVLRSPRGTAARGLLPAWIAAMLLPNLLSVEAVPHALRSCGVIPAVALVAGVGAVWVEQTAGRRIGRTAAASILVTGLVLTGLGTGWRYFRVWGGDPVVAAAHDASLRAAAVTLRDAGAGVARFVIANGEGYPAYGHPIETQIYHFELRDVQPVSILGPKDTERLVLGGRPAMAAFIRRDERALAILKALNPGASVEEVRGAGLSPASPVYRVR